MGFNSPKFCFDFKHFYGMILDKHEVCIYANHTLIHEMT